MPRKTGTENPHGYDPKSDTVGSGSTTWRACY